MTDLMLCVTELVTNSVQHPDAPHADEVEVSVHLSGDIVRVEVDDHGRGFEQEHVGKERGSGGGWGLYIVDLLSDRWGVDRGDRTRVWLEIDLGGSGARP
jgi:anti-sigma regulatory factor (Ser/Thr protein kinase)